MLGEEAFQQVRSSWSSGLGNVVRFRGSSPPVASAHWSSLWPGKISAYEDHLIKFCSLKNNDIVHAIAIAIAKITKNVASMTVSNESESKVIVNGNSTSIESMRAFRGHGCNRVIDDNDIVITIKCNAINYSTTELATQPTMWWASEPWQKQW